MRYPLRYPRGVTIYKSKRGFIIYGRVVDGKPRPIQRTREEDALEVAAQLSRGDLAPTSDATLEQIADEWLTIGRDAEGWSKSYLKNQRKNLNSWILPHVSGPAHSITRPKLAMIAGRVRAEVQSPAYQQQILGTLKRVWEYAVMMGYVPQERFSWGAVVGKAQRVQGQSKDFVDPSKRPDTKSVLRLIDAAPEPFSGALIVGAFSGLRWGEMAALEPEDVDLDAGTISVTRQGQWQDGVWVVALPKGQKTRTTILPEIMLMKLAPIVKATEPGSLLFPAPNGEPWKVNRFYEEFRRIGSHVDWPKDWSFHSLRHHFATWMLAKLSVQDVAALMGHSSPDVTYRLYVGVNAGLVDRAREATKDLL